ncbi:MAG: hypothetical protein VZQ78_08865 [Prevotella sp.]|nr:hypothetical protein [Prevotella sp.]
MITSTEISVLNMNYDKDSSDWQDFTITDICLQGTTVHFSLAMDGISQGEFFLLRTTAMKHEILWLLCADEDIALPLLLPENIRWDLDFSDDLYELDLYDDEVIDVLNQAVIMMFRQYLSDISYPYPLHSPMLERFDPRELQF